MVLTSTSTPRERSWRPCHSSTHAKVNQKLSSCMIHAFFQPCTSVMCLRMTESVHWPFTIRASVSHRSLTLLKVILTDFENSWSFKIGHYWSSFSWCRSPGLGVPGMGLDPLAPQCSMLSHLWVWRVWNLNMFLPILPFFMWLCLCQ